MQTYVVKINFTSNYILDVSNNPEYNLMLYYHDIATSSPVGGVLDGPQEMQRISIFEIFLLGRLTNKPELRKSLEGEKHI